MQPDETQAALKQELKRWEASFFAEHGRRPIAADIACHPIAKQYRKYESLKKAATTSSVKSSSSLRRIPSISKGAVSKHHLDRIRKGFSFLNQTIPIPSTSSSIDPPTSISGPESELNSTSLQMETACIDRSCITDENSDPLFISNTLPPQPIRSASMRFRRTSSTLSKTDSFISPLATISKTTSNIELPESDDDDDAAHEMQQLSVDTAADQSLDLGELAQKYLAAAAAEVFVPESSCSDTVKSVLVPLSEPDPKPVNRPCRRASTERLSLTTNFIKYDLKHDWKSKSKSSRKPRWKSAKMFALEMKKKRIEEHNAALYTELLEDDLILIQMKNNQGDVPAQVNSDTEDCHPDFKRRRIQQQEPVLASKPVEENRFSGEFNRDIATTVLSKIFGFSSFRPNQFEVIERIMRRQSTLAVLPTGAGKSLLYQMPAYLLPGLCLVITPLLSLMKDQLQHLPESIPGAIWSSNETVSQVHDLIKKLRLGQIKVLFLSPERLQTAGFQRVIQSLPSPSVSFACIDEVHCVSQWSHNFRPAFVRIGSILRKHINVQCILALTATATKQTLHSVCRTLSLDVGDVIQAGVRRDNLLLSVSRENDRFAALIQLLQSERFRKLSSIIIYVHQQRTADEVMFNLRSQGIDAASYHAGKDAKTRRYIQEQFMSNKIRIICATIAFGMGLDKCDVRAVIHFNSPQSMEHYVQEIGRAGRDGHPAYCHVFYDEDDADRFRSLAFSNGVDDIQVSKFLKSLFGEYEEHDGHYFVALSCSKQVQAYDLREEVVETFLTYLEFETGVGYIHTLPMMHNKCTIRFLRTPEQQLAKADPILAEIINQSMTYSGALSVNIVKVANAAHVSVADVQRTILTLKSLGQISAVWKDLSFCIDVLRVPDDIDALCTDLLEFCCRHESCTFRKVNIISQLLKSVATERCSDINPDCQQRLQQMISTYFVCDNDEQLIAEAESLLPDYESINVLCQERERPEHLIGDVKVLLLQWRQKISTPRQVSRILHGISSPKFPYKEWCKYPAWGKYVSYPFEKVLADAAMVLKSLAKIDDTPNRPRSPISEPVSISDSDD